MYCALATAQVFEQTDFCLDVGIPTLDVGYLSTTNVIRLHGWFSHMGLGKVHVLNRQFCAAARTNNNHAVLLSAVGK